MTEFNYDQSAHVYRAMPGLNKSSIEKLLDCPLAYKLSLEQEDEPTPAMAFGTLVHSMILEPGTVPSLYHVMQASATTKAGKAEKAQALEEGKTIVSASDFAKAQAMQARVLAHPAASWLLGTASLRSGAAKSSSTSRRIAGPSAPAKSSARLRSSATTGRPRGTATATSASRRSPVRASISSS